MDILASEKSRSKSQHSASPSRVKKRPTIKAATKTMKPTATAIVSTDMIAIAAYFRAERRGFEPGHELEDWLAAEKEICARH